MSGRKRNLVEIPSYCDNCKNSGVMFCNLSTSEKRTIGETKGDLFFKKGSIIFREGEHANSLFCVYKGKIKLVKLGKEGKEQIIRLSRTGDILGYRSLLSSEPYKATAIAMEDSYLCEISKSKFLSVVENNTNLSLRIIELLSNDLKSAEQQLVDITQKKVKERVSEALLLLANTFGYLVDGETLNIKITRAEIAELAGTTTESAIRVLSQLNSEKLIRLSGKNIVILDFKGLVDCSNALD